MEPNRREFLKSAAWLAGLALNDQLLFSSRVAGLRVAVIGHTGRGNYGHGLDTMWLDAPECTLVAVADADPGGLASARQRLGGISYYADYREMLEAGRPDIVCVAPRHLDQHHDMVIAAANAGTKGIYLEKPFCRNLAEADAIQAICRTKKIKLQLAHRNRFHPALSRAQKLVEEGYLGDVVEVRGRGKEDHRGGPQDLWVLGSHILNLVPLFTGPLTGCAATILKEKRPVGRKDLYQGDEGTGLIGGDRLHARFSTESGVPFYFDSIRNAGVKAGNFGFQLLGNKGVLDIRIDTEPLISFFPANPFFPQNSRPEWIPVTSNGPGEKETFPEIARAVAGHQAAIKDLVDAIREDRPVLCNETDGRATVEAIMGAFESHRLGGAWVGFPLPVDGNPLENLL